MPELWKDGLIVNYNVSLRLIVFLTLSALALVTLALLRHGVGLAYAAIPVAIVIFPAALCMLAWCVPSLRRSRGWALRQEAGKFVAIALMVCCVASTDSVLQSFGVSSYKNVLYLPLILAVSIVPALILGLYISGTRLSEAPQLLRDTLYSLRHGEWPEDEDESTASAAEALPELEDVHPLQF